MFQAYRPRLAQTSTLPDCVHVLRRQSSKVVALVEKVDDFRQRRLSWTIHSGFLCHMLNDAGLEVGLHLVFQVACLVRLP